MTKPTWGDMRAQRDPEWDAEQVARVDPEEPVEGTVLRFTKARWGKPYSYAAIRAVDVWYLTNGQHYLWRELLDFIQKGEDVEVVVEKFLPHAPSGD
jgi:hypothetical protein